MGHHQLDKLDESILKLVATNARIPFLEVARACNVSGAAIHQRIQKLTNLGVLKGSEFVIDSEKIGYETCAYMGLFLKNPENFDAVFEGLKAIPEVRENIFRPLLNFEKAEILEYLKNNNLEHTEDNSNQDTTYARNYIRHEILPNFEKINPTYKNSISNLIEVAKGESEILDFVLEKTKEDIFENEKINTQKFLKLIYPLQLKLMYNYLKSDLKFFDYKRFQRIVDFIIEHANKEDNFHSRKYVKFSINSKLFLYVNTKEIFKGE